MDVNDIQSLLAQFAPTEADKNAALRQGLLAAGLGMLGARKGEEWNAIGRGGLLGVGTYQNNLSTMQRQRMEGLQTAGAALGLKDKMRQMDDADAQRNALAEFYAKQGVPGAAPAQSGMPGPVGAPVSPGIAPAGTTPPMGPGNAPAQIPQQPAGKQTKFDQYMQLSDFYASKGLSQAAQQAADMAEKFRPKLKDTKTLMQNGQRVTVNLYDDGTTSVVPFAPDAEKLQQVDMGNAITFVDPYTGKPPTSPSLYNKSQTPDSAASVAATIRGQNMTDARAREANNAGVIHETADGLVRIGRDNSVTPIAGPDGAPLQAKPTGAIQQQIASNSVTLNKVDRALQMVQQVPGAFGLKNYLGDAIRQRTDPGGVNARALIADIAGQKIHDRSGAAVTAGEAERLKPYVPNVTDDASTISKKLSLFKTEYVQMQRELMGGKSLAEVGAAPRGAVVDFNSLPK